MIPLSLPIRFIQAPLQAARSPGTATLLFVGTAVVALMVMTVRMAFDLRFSDSSASGGMVFHPQNFPDQVKAAGTAHNESAATVHKQINQSHSRLYRAVGRDMKWHFSEQIKNQPALQPQIVMRGSVMELQVGQTAVIEVLSDDYLYLLTLPDGRSQIGVPEMSHQIEFVATEQGRFELKADPMCGFRFLHDDEVQGLLVVSQATTTSH